MIHLKDRLSHLTYRQASKLLGPEGEHLIRQGGKFDFDIEEQVNWSEDLLKINLGDALVTFSLTPEKPGTLGFACSECTKACVHLGAAFSLILEEKLALGLSAPPPDKVPVESLSDEELVKLATEERAERAKTEKMSLRSTDGQDLWADYMVTNRSSGKSYRVALRGWERGDSYCSCPDFRKNTLGTCKHILYALSAARNRFPKSVLEKPYEITGIAVHLRYGEETELRVLVPGALEGQITTLLRPFMDRPIKNVGGFLECIRQIESREHEVTIYPDAEEYIQRALYLIG
jgi:hypothetical protein